MVKYTQIIIVGSSQLAEGCRKIVFSLYPTVKTLFYNTKDISKNIIMEELRHVKEPSIVFSVMNPFLFPTYVVENLNLKMINLHHALLPNHPGRNAEAWAIFNGDPIAGITWHYITKEVDAGKILQQETIEIHETMTSLQLFRKMNDLALKSFPRILAACMCGQAKGYAQQISHTTVVHLSKERPGNGYLNLEWDAETMFRFLRSMDYGILNTLGKPKIKLENKTYIWKKYAYLSSNESDGICMNKEFIAIRKQNKVIKLLKIQEVKGEL